MRFWSGALGQIEVTTAARPDDLRCRAVSPRRTRHRRHRGLSANRLSVWTPDPSSVSSYSEDIPRLTGFGHKLFYRDVVADPWTATPAPIGAARRCFALVQPLHAIYLCCLRPKW